MPSFTFNVDRVHVVKAPIPLYPSAELTGASETAEPGETLVYRGVVELDGTPRYAFKRGERIVYAADRGVLDAALEEDLGALPRLG